MDYRKTNAPSNTVTRDMMKLSSDTGNVYETVAIIGKRANQIAVEMKQDLEKKLQEFKTEGKVIEARAYNTVYGVWTYFTADDGQIDLKKGHYLGIGTLESYQKMRNYYGESNVVPVYIEVEDGYDFKQVSAAIKADDYFAHDETHVMRVECVDNLLDMGHGVNLVRKGVSGKTQNQLIEFDMKINNPALTAQILVSVARASLKQQPGAYTMIELPIIDMLYGERENLIRRLV